MFRLVLERIPPSACGTNYWHRSHLWRSTESDILMPRCLSSASTQLPQCLLHFRIYTENILSQATTTMRHHKLGDELCVPRICRGMPVEDEDESPRLSPIMCRNDPKIITRETLTSQSPPRPVCWFKRFEDENKYFNIGFDAVKCKYRFIN